jgi:hypothetical protein
MQLEAGKKYTDRRGRVYGPLMKTSCFFGESEGRRTWCSCGSIQAGDICPMDLVAEYVEPVQPEYRMLHDGEIINGDDEWNDGRQWRKACGGINRPFNSHIHVPHRRLVPAAPVESPDDWVELRPSHVMRRGVDQFYNVDEWQDVIGYHGSRADSTKPGRARCRRKDLPPMPPKTRTVVLKEWICWQNDEPETVLTAWGSTSPAITSEAYEAAFDNAIETGETRTVEIPVT